MLQGMVEIVHYRQEWPAAFEREAAAVTAVLGGRIDAIEHIGSTAIPGLSAKPIIDLAARATPGIDPFSLAPELGPVGYVMHRSGPRTHGVYIREVDGLRTHILHVFSADRWETCNQRLFRDKLLRDASARERYARVKSDAASTEDGREYTARKTGVVEELLNEERASRGLPPTRAWEK